MVVEFDSGILRRPNPAKTRMSSDAPAADTCSVCGSLFPNVISGGAFDDLANPIIVPIINTVTITAEIIRSVRSIFRQTFSCLSVNLSTSSG